MQKYAAFLLVPGFAIIGAAKQHREWLGGIAGGMIGLFFALLITGVLPKQVLDWIFPRSQNP